MFQIEEKHEEEEEEELTLTSNSHNSTSTSTEFFQWSFRHFAQPVIKKIETNDPESGIHHRREYRFLRNGRVRDVAHEEQSRAGACRVANCFRSKSYSVD